VSAKGAKSSAKAAPKATSPPSGVPTKVLGASADSKKKLQNLNSNIGRIIIIAKSLSEAHVAKICRW
jgi:hypothetical protein